MKFIKLGILSFIILFVVITCISFFIPAHIRISKAINIHSSCDSMFVPIDDLHRWSIWNPFIMNASNVTISGDSTATAGSVNISWKQRQGNQHTAQMENENGRKVISGWTCLQNTVQDSVTLQWYMDFHLKWYPWEKFGSLMLERSYGSRMELGLSNLKRLLEN